ncbi:MAG: SRPBCC family protein, partial [Pseudonocardiales bacterium]|nr:SRPBCC family protein [Pseudonocardiales bacterium]
FWWWERVDVPGGPAAPAVWLVAGPAVRVLFGHALRRFARWVEANAESPAPRR